MAGRETDRAAASRLAAGTRALVLTVSDGVAAGGRAGRIRCRRRIPARGDRRDRSTRAVVADDLRAIAATIRTAAETHELVVSTGGTGLTPRDVTPQAVRSILDYEIPGIGEAMRAAGRGVHAARRPVAAASAGSAAARSSCACRGVRGGALESLAARRSRSCATPSRRLPAPTITAGGRPSSAATPPSRTIGPEEEDAG